MAEKRQIAVRLPEVLIRQIDERAERFKRSRNEWIELALTRTVEAPRQVTSRQESF